MMRSLSGIEERQVVYAPVSCAQLMEELTRTAGIMAGSGDLNVMVDSGTLPEVVWADASLIYEVYENILNNALRHAREEIHIKLCVEGRELVLECADDGEGFKDSPERLTEKFYRFGIDVYKRQDYTR